MLKVMTAVAGAVALLGASAGAAEAATPTASSEVGRVLVDVCVPVMRGGVPFEQALKASGLETSRAEDGYWVGRTGVLEVVFPGAGDGCEVRMIAAADQALAPNMAPSAIRREAAAIARALGFQPAARPMPPKAGGAFSFGEAFCRPADEPQQMIVLAGTPDDSKPARAILVTLASTSARPALC